LQQWIAASDAGTLNLYYYTYGDKRTSELPTLMKALKEMNVGQLWSMVKEGGKSTPVGPGGAAIFRSWLMERAKREDL
jgi:hypothetical protein